MKAPSPEVSAWMRENNLSLICRTVKFPEGEKFFLSIGPAMDSRQAREQRRITNEYRLGAEARLWAEAERLISQGWKRNT